MSLLATTKLSSKGQIVIPEDIRQKMGLHVGDQFVVIADKDVMVLKAIMQSPLGEFNNLIVKARKEAKKVGLNKQSIKEAIKEARKK